jgi:hypothetical protein
VYLAGTASRRTDCETEIPPNIQAQVERWFGLLTDKQIRRGAHKNVQALEKDIRNWIKIWNEDPKPFAWTRTADEILERLAGYLNRIPNSGH